MVGVGPEWVVGGGRLEANCRVWTDEAGLVRWERVGSDSARRRRSDVARRIRRGKRWQVGYELM